MNQVMGAPTNQLEMLIFDIAMVQQGIQNTAMHCTALEASMATLQLGSEIIFRDDTGPAMDALLVLVNRIEELHQHVQGQKSSALTAGPTSALGEIQARATLVNACKSQSRVVFDYFQSLHQKAKSLTDRFSELAMDFTFQISLSQQRIGRLRDMIQIGEMLYDGAERERESWEEQKEVAEEHAQRARETIRYAERRIEKKESARVVRNIFTLGIGEVFDLFDFNEDIEDSEYMVASAERNARACAESIQQANNALNRIGAQVACLDTLGGAVQIQENALHAMVAYGQGVRTRTLNLTNTSLDVSLFVGALAAKSETFAVHHTAQEFAQSVLGFGRLMVSDGSLNNLLVQRDPATLQETLDMIAQSDDAGDGRFIGTQQSQLPIEDMM